ncbi:MAG: flagellar protein FlaG [Sporomusaceae bacterium]|nr:flagellar protein FlaG [Sporomusaceae bacterium]
MDVSALKKLEPANITTYPSVSSVSNNPVQKRNELESQAASKPPAKIGEDRTELSKSELITINQQLNKFMSLINADIQFQVHERTKQLMVQVVDTKANKVLKEFPSHEMLDVLANIREHVGVLLDKKA